MASRIFSLLEQCVADTRDTQRNYNLPQDVRLAKGRRAFAFLRKAIAELAADAQESADRFTASKEAGLQDENLFQEAIGEHTLLRKAVRLGEHLANAFLYGEDGMRHWIPESRDLGREILAYARHGAPTVTEPYRNWSEGKRQARAASARLKAELEARHDDFPYEHMRY